MKQIRQAVILDQIRELVLERREHQDARSAPAQCLNAASDGIERLRGPSVHGLAAGPNRVRGELRESAAVQAPIGLEASTSISGRW